MKQSSTQFQRPETLSRILGLSRFRPSLTDANTALMRHHAFPLTTPQSRRRQRETGEQVRQKLVDILEEVFEILDDDEDFH